MASDILSVDLVALAVEIVGFAAVAHIDTRIDACMPVTWRQGMKFAKSENVYTQALGFAIMLTAVLDTPGASQALVESLRDGLQGIFEDEADRAA